MRPSLALKALLGSILLVVMSGAKLPKEPKTEDFSDNGLLCDEATEQYLQVEAFDRYPEVDIILRFRQTSGPCGAPLTEDPAYWETFYDFETDGIRRGKFQQLNLFVCAPFGEYTVNIEVKRPDGNADKKKGKVESIAWEVEHGFDEHHIWDTLNNDLKDIDYNPTLKGNYSWPLEGATGFYKSIYAGPMPPIVCVDLPEGIANLGCFKDPPSNPLLKSKSETRQEKGPVGMSLEACSEICEEYYYYGLSSGSKCSCGTADHFKLARPSDKCDVNYHFLCTGDATVTCGGEDAIRVYHRTNEDPSPVPDIAPPPDTNDGNDVDEDENVDGGNDGGGDGGSGDIPGYKGCFKDKKRDRAMNEEGKNELNDLTNQACIEFCSARGHAYAGTEKGVECWCGGSYDKYRKRAALCTTPCLGDGDQICGGNKGLSVYSTGA